MAIKSEKLKSLRQTSNSIALRQMLSLKEGDTFVAESETNKIFAYASKHGIKVKTKKLFLTDPKDMSQRIVYEIEVVSKPKEKPVLKYWEDFLEKMPTNQKTESIRTLIKKYYEQEEV